MQHLKTTTLCNNLLRFALPCYLSKLIVCVPINKVFDRTLLAASWLWHLRMTPLSVEAKIALWKFGTWSTGDWYRHSPGTRLVVVASVSHVVQVCSMLCWSCQLPSDLSRIANIPARPLRAPGTFCFWFVFDCTVCAPRVASKRCWQK